MAILVVAVQLLALFSIAGALFIYLLCKVREDSNANILELQSSRRVVLITSADTAFGLQLCTYLANKGCRVFAGMKDAKDSLPAKLLSGWIKMREYADEPLLGAIIPLQLDVTREDILREATIAMGAHLNAGELGISAVINTSGSFYRGKIECQDVQQWEQMFKINILGSLRVAKAFLNFLRPTRGRLIYLGSSNNAGEGLVAFNTSRMAVEKCAEELRRELQPYGVNVVALDTCQIPAEDLYKPPEAQSVCDADGTQRTQYSADILNAHSLHTIEKALWDFVPEQRYKLQSGSSTNKFPFMLACRSSVRLQKPNSVSPNKVQTV